MQSAEQIALYSCDSGFRGLTIDFLLFQKANESFFGDAFGESSPAVFFATMAHWTILCLFDIMKFTVATKIDEHKNLQKLNIVNPKSWECQGVYGRFHGIGYATALLVT